MTCSSIRTAAALCFVSAPLAAQALDTTGVSDTFSSLLNPRFKTFSRASTDPNDDAVHPSFGNDDGFTGRNQCEAYRESDAYGEYSVLTHQEGRPGYVSSFFRNFWGGLAGVVQLPWENTRAQWLFENTLFYDMPMIDYFRSPGHPLGQIAPFDGEFTQSRAGGHITYAPHVWENSFKLRVADNWFDNASRFHRVTGVLGTWDDTLEIPSRTDWEAVAAAAGGWPHKTPRVANQTVLVLPGSGGQQQIVLAGPATLLELTVTVADPSHWDGLVARFTFDGAATPQVDIPLRLLGAMVRQPFSAPVSTLLMNNNGTDRITCYFPMHFASSATLSFVNDNAKSAQITVDYCLASGAHPQPWGHFTTAYDEGITTYLEAFDGATIENAHGMMRFMALESSIDNFSGIPKPVSLMHIEGDLCVRINGNKGDDHEYAATETSIGHWGWYDSPADVPFDSDCSFHTGIMTNSISKKLFETDRMQGTTMVFDPVHYADGIEIKLEHGSANRSNAIYRFFTFHYVSPDGPAREVVMELDVGDPVDEATRFVSFTEAAPSFTPTHGFFRDFQYQTAPVADSVRVIDTLYHFRADDPGLVNYDAFCVGVRLERDRPTLDGGVAQADVYVDGLWAGLVHSPTSNEWFPWKEGGELEVEIPRALTAGKTQFQVEFRPRAGGDPFHLARIWLYGY